jgi:hypothetical protein
MRQLITITLVSLLMLMLFGQALADVKLKTSGEIRMRCEFDGRSFDEADSALVNTGFLRTRVNLKAKINNNVKAFVQFQDSRRLADNDAFGAPTSGGLNDGESVDLHQAFILIDNLWSGGIGLKAGRFEVNLGNQRVFGAVGWSNVGRVWDGLQPFFKSGDVVINGYWLKKMDRFHTERNHDFDIYGVSLDFPSINMQIFGFMEKDAQRVDTTDFGSVFTPYHDALSRNTIGVYYVRDWKQFDFTLNAAYQFGKLMYWTEPTVDSLASAEMDISAAMLTFEAGITFDSDINARLAAGVDYTSGDNDADDDFKTYNNMYYTGHKFRGHMDYFIAPDPDNPKQWDNAGLIDIYLGGKLNPDKGWTIKGDLHFFKTAVDYFGGSGMGNIVTNNIGTEFDLSVSTTRIAGVNLSCGASLFMPNEDFINTAADEIDDTTIWMWTMLSVNF